MTDDLRTAVAPSLLVHATVHTEDGECVHSVVGGAEDVTKCVERLRELARVEAAGRGATMEWCLAYRTHPDRSPAAAWSSWSGSAFADVASSFEIVGALEVGRG